MRRRLRAEVVQVEAVLEYGHWSRRLARHPGVLGRAVYVKGVPFTIVGVAAPGFAGVERDKASTRRSWIAT